MTPRFAYERGKAAGAAAVVARVEAVVDQWPVGDNGQEYRQAVTQCADTIRAALAPDADALADLVRAKQAEALREVRAFIADTSGIGERGNDFADGWYQALNHVLDELAARADSIEGGPR